jgi:hypothetical protein
MGIIEQLEKINRYHIYTVALISIGLPLLFPQYFKQPITVTAMTEGIFDAIEALEPGDYVVSACDFSAKHYADVGAPMTRLFQYYLEAGVKLILMEFLYPSTVLLMDNLVIPKFEAWGGVYGENWVHLGYLPGRIPALISFASDPRRLTDTDAYGNALEDLPMLQPLFDEMDATGDKFIELPQIKLIQANGIDYTRNTWTIPYGLTEICITTTMAAMLYMPYYNAKIYTGMTYGIRGGAELEILLGEVGTAQGYISAMSLQHTVWFAFIVIANIIYWGKRLSGGKK